MVQRRGKLFYATLTTVGVLVLLLLAVGSVAAGGNGAARDFEAIDVACSMFDGNGDLNFAGILISDDPLFDGAESLTEITFSNNGKLLVNSIIIPQGYSEGTMLVSPGQGGGLPEPASKNSVVHHHGSGTGELEGLHLVFTADGISPDGVGNPCPGDPAGDPVILVGKIIAPPQGMP